LLERPAKSAPAMDLGCGWKKFRRGDDWMAMDSSERRDLMWIKRKQIEG
jgi:hypothetical protein